MIRSKYDKKFFPLEIALLLALAFTAIWGAWSLQRQDALEQGMIRLHVIAHSDDPADQALKLQVRDRILSVTEDYLAAGADRDQAMTALEKSLPDLERAAAEVICENGGDYPVHARLERTEFPEKRYDGFALPAGKYTALRVIIGEGKGRNWWCVVFPPLCHAAAEDVHDTALAAGMLEDDVALITEESMSYVLKFRSLELWESFRQWLGK